MIGLLRYKSLVVEVSSRFLKRVVSFESVKNSVSLPLCFDGFILYRNTLFPVIGERSFESFLYEKEPVEKKSLSEKLSNSAENARTRNTNSSRRLFALLVDQKNHCALPVAEVLTIIDDAVSSAGSLDTDILLDVPAMIEHITSRKGQ